MEGCTGTEDSRSSVAADRDCRGRRSALRRPCDKRFHLCLSMIPMCLRSQPERNDFGITPPQTHKYRFENTGTTSEGSFVDFLRCSTGLDAGRPGALPVSRVHLTPVTSLDSARPLTHVARGHSPRPLPHVTKNNLTKNSWRHEIGTAVAPTAASSSAHYRPAEPRRAPASPDPQPAGPAPRFRPPQPPTHCGPRAGTWRAPALRDRGHARPARSAGVRPRPRNAPARHAWC